MISSVDWGHKRMSCTCVDFFWGTLTCLWLSKCFSGLLDYYVTAPVILCYLSPGLFSEFDLYVCDFIRILKAMFEKPLFGVLLYSTLLEFPSLLDVHHSCKLLYT